MSALHTQSELMGCTMQMETVSIVSSVCPAAKMGRIGTRVDILAEIDVWEFGDG